MDEHGTSSADTVTEPSQSGVFIGTNSQGQVVDVKVFGDVKTREVDWLLAEAKHWLTKQRGF